VGQASDLPTPAGGLRHWPWIISAACAVIALVAMWGWWRLASSPEPPRAVTRSAMTSGATFYAPALSRNGTRLAYMEVASPFRIWLRMMDQLEGHPIPGTDGIVPAFSPDGQWISYIKVPGPYQLKKIPVTGGTSIVLCDLQYSGVSDLSWGDDDSIFIGSARGLMRVPAAGGRFENLTTPDAKQGETGHFRPELLPGGQAILFEIATGASLDADRVAVLDLKTRTYHAIVNSGWAARYVPTGHLVYRRGAALFAAPFDLKGLAVTGAEAPVVEGISAPRLPTTGAEYAFSSTGLLVFREGGAPGTAGTAIAWMDRKGDVQTLPEPPHNWGGLRLSPDGKKVAGSIQGDASSNVTGGNPHIWIYDLERGILTPLTSSESSDNSPAWSPDGKYITFRSSRGDKSGIYRIPADSSGPPEMLASTESQAIAHCWTPDGKTLVYSQADQGKVQIWVLSPSATGGDGKPRRFRPEATSQEDQPQISPDGKSLAYISDQSGRWEIYVSPFPGPGGKFPVSTQGGRLPVWSHNGRELFYAELNPRRVMAVEIGSGPSFQAGRPQPLFIIRNDSGGAGFGVSPDGKKFLVRRPQENATGSTFMIVTDWFTELLRRVPVKR
jgi:serine/threonine-protein kinase